MAPTPERPIPSDAPDDRGQAAGAHELRRSLGLFDVTALGINTVIGSGIFLLPGLAAERLGPAALTATLAAGLLACLVALCFAEVGSRFTVTGGPYVYARAAFGRPVGFAVGWITCWTGLVAWAALLNAFTTALSHFAPAVASGWPHKATITGLLVFFAAVNLLGAKQGAWVSNIATVAKLAALIAFVVLGLRYAQAARLEPFAPLGYGAFGSTVLLMLYAFVGFENLVVPAGEMRRPRREVPRALLLVMGIVTLLYAGVQSITYATLDDPAGRANAVADAADGFLGTGGIWIAMAIVVSILGVNSASAVIAPRRFYALAENREMPAFLARVHPRFGSPWAAILATYVLTGLLALTGTFRELAVITVVGRLLQYIPTCLAAPVLRRRESAADNAGGSGFRLPFGPLLPTVAIALCLALLGSAEPRQLAAGGVALASAVPVWLWIRRRG